MKKKIVRLAALLSMFFIPCALLLSSCENTTPVDMQSEDDDPIFLKPYETEDGLIHGKTTNPDPYVDSVLVTPSAYTTVNWYLDGVKVHTADINSRFRIEKCFPSGTYDMLIEAVTTKGKRTTRSGILTVNPADADPYITTRVMAPGVAMTMNGKNLEQVEKLVLSKDFYGEDIVCTVVPVNKEATKMDITLPELEDGTYYMGLLDAEGARFGSDKLQVQNASLALSGFASFNAGEEWTITGANLQNVASVTVGEIVITDLTATATAVIFTAPNLEEGEYTLSMRNQDGSAVLFFTSSGLVESVSTRAAALGETTIWEGSCVVDWGDANVNIEKDVMSTVPAGATIYVYYNVPEAEYHSLRVVVAPDWSADILPQVDGMDWQPNPYSFVYTAEHKALAEADDKNGILVTGHGLEITQVTYK